MIDISRIIQNGRLTRDADVRFSNSGTAICKFSIASNGYKEEVSYFNVVAFGKLAENLGKYLTKGKAVTVDGKLKQDRWEKDGVKRSSVNIIAENIQLHAGNTHDNVVGGSPSQSSGASPNDNQEFDEDGIPF